MILPIVCCILIGASAAIPSDDFRSNFEFFEYDTNLAEPGYRLRDVVYPHVMNIDLDVDLNASRFDGVVQMVVEVREANLRQIVLHQKVESIENVNVYTANNVVVNQYAFTTDDHFELLKINLVTPLALANYTIRIEYKGLINENPIDRGFYKGYYFRGNEEVPYATTQFQPGNARKAFPCFDEPMFKSQYQLNITRDINLRPSYSNMPIADTQVNGNRVTEVFHPTPIISAYLIAFHVSDFVETNTTSIAARPFNIISRPGVENQHLFAADMAVRITNELDDYLGILYHEMGPSEMAMKNDHIALPDFPSGAMENWGMVNYREAYLLYDQNNTNIPNKIFIAAIVAHELAHKWFGNLVTTFWWSNLWLNESFASYFEYFAAHWADSKLELDDQFIVDSVHSALSADSSTGANPMNWTGVENLDSITNHFSTSSYAKGASVLRMLEHFMGSRNFRTALRYYIRDNAYGVGTNEDMFAAFRKAALEDFQFQNELLENDVDIGDVFESWVQNPGSPVVKVTFSNGTGSIQVSQERYTLSGNRSDFDHIWQIPLSWTNENEHDFLTLKPKNILTTRNDSYSTSQGDYWVLFNIAQSGLYRVNYDDANWNRLGNYLKRTRTHIHRMNRAQIANDLLHFIHSRDLNQTLAFTVLEFLADETDYYVWKGALPRLEFIHRRYEHMELAHTEFRTYLLNTLETVIQHLGYDENLYDSTSHILNRMQIMNLACNLGHVGCVNDSLTKWNALRNATSQPVPVNARRYVYCVGLRHGNSSDYQFLLNMYENSENTADMVVILRALGCTRDVDSLNSYLSMSLTSRKIRIHDKANVVSFALQGNRENLPVVLEFIYNNFTDIRDNYGGPARLNMTINAVPGFLTNYTLITEFSEWVYTHQVELGTSFPAAASAVNTAMNNLNWGNDNVREIYDYLLVRNSSNVFFVSTVLMLATLIIHLFR